MLKVFAMDSKKTTPEHWITIQKNQGLANNTIDAYQRALRDYSTFCSKENLSLNNVTREHITLYVRDLQDKIVEVKNHSNLGIETKGLSNSTILQRLTAVRLYYDFLMEEGIRNNNPVGRGSSKNILKKGIIPRYHTLPWIPNEIEWNQILQCSKKQSLRNKLMLAIAYDAGLRREELCSISIGDLDPAHRLIHIRAETTKGRRTRVTPYSASTGQLLIDYLKFRQSITNSREALFVSESKRNFSKPITLWTWSKVVRKIAKDSGVLKLSTHTFRHLCLTDLARSGWELHEIATFAGHRNITTTLLYIHLSGRELTKKLANSMTSHYQRMQQIMDSFGAQNE